MKFKLIILLLTSLIFKQSNAQRVISRDTLKMEDRDSVALMERIAAIENGYFIRGKVIDGDTVLHIYTGEIIIFPSRKYISRKQYRRYTRLVRYVKKVYPYSLIIKYQLDAIEAQIDTIYDPRERKRVIKSKEKELRNAFEGQLVKLTILQGRILLKLVDRQTGFTTYELLDNLKGSFSASFWQSVARIFGSDLKKEFDAEGDDAMIEEIIILIENGQL